jgi:hypothetical protein
MIIVLGLGVGMKGGSKVDNQNEWYTTELQY